MFFNPVLFHQVTSGAGMPLINDLLFQLGYSKALSRLVENGNTNRDNTLWFTDDEGCENYVYGKLFDFWPGLVEPGWETLSYWMVIGSKHSDQTFVLLKRFSKESLYTYILCFTDVDLAITQPLEKAQKAIDSFEKNELIWTGGRDNICLKVERSTVHYFDSIRIKTFGKLLDQFITQPS